MTPQSIAHTVTHRYKRHLHYQKGQHLRLFFKVLIEAVLFMVGLLWLVGRNAR